MTNQLNDAQIRLLIPSEMVSELDTLAKVKLTTRLGLIRRYLRDRIDHDLANLNEHLQRRNEIKKSKAQLDSWLQSNHQEPDEW